MGRADGSGTTSSGRGRWIIMLVALSAGLIGLIDATVDFIAAPGLWPALWILLVPGLVVVGLLAWRSERLRQAADRFGRVPVVVAVVRSEEHTSELQSLMRISYAVFCLKKKNYYYHF